MRNLLSPRESMIEMDISRRGSGQLQDCGQSRFILAQVIEEPSNHPVTRSFVSWRSVEVSFLWISPP
jgi:hypothetical protein